MKQFSLILLSVFFFSCSNISETEIEDITPEKLYKKVTIFNEVDTAFSHQDLKLPEGFTYQILYTEDRDSVVYGDNLLAPAKGSHDMMEFIPSGMKKGTLYVGHEDAYHDELLGDGGSGTFFDLEFDGTQWNITSPKHHVSFENVGGTNRNCGGTTAPNGMIMTCEESYPTTNKGIWRNGTGHLDTMEYNGRPKYENFGFIVEVDPSTRKPVQKLISMGRYMHEDAEFMPDGKTVYLSDDNDPAVFFKFEADVKNDYSQGQLFAFQMNQLGEKGKWLELPRDTTSLLNIRDIAIAKGATLFIRHEWMISHNGKLYINETGADKFSWEEAKRLGGKPAPYLKMSDDTTYVDVYGRVLMYDLETQAMDILIEGGVGQKDSTKVFSNPDCNTIYTRGEKSWLVLNEDINWNSLGRVAPYAEEKGEFYNELYFLDLDIENPTVDDMERFLVAPKGAETTGTTFSPDGKTMFVNIQHPWPRNVAPFNKSMTIAIQGF